ncbi:E3 ubiquitin-protein ligase UPL4 isoform X1 [Musa acuminata AAA Group]|uniref:E3 ubiquitin-protein ligase UPL4 isoform X1 n=2 Tax=Musa acuminata AAA Group TaxID=214697 RepID=UPI0031CFF371
MDRNRKREAIDGRSQEKRACSSSEFRPCSSTSSSLPPPPPQTDSEMESSSSGRSDRAGDSGYGSCDSDDFAGGYDSRNLVGRGRLQRVFSGLLDDGSGGSAQLAALTELCEVLSFCMEDAVGYFPLETVVPPLVKLASHESSPDVMLLAIRALTYLCDAMPRSAEAIVRHGALPVLCGRLLAIEYLDVAEQSLQALEKISRKQPVPCLQAGTIAAVLTYIDFFPTNPQRVAVSTVANVCKKLPPDCSTIVIESVPILCSLLQYEDHKLVETVAACLVRITDCFAGSSELLDELCKHGIIQKSLNLIANDGHRSLSRATYSGLIGLLRKLATSSLVAVQTLFELNISRTLMGILMSSDMLRDSAYMSVQDMQTNQVYEVLKLANQLIPPVLRDVPDDQIELAKEKILVDQPNFLHEFSTDILPVSVQVVNSGANAYVCYACVSIINSIAYFSTPDILLDSIKSTNISSFLAGLLSRKDPHVLFLTLKTVEVLMQKLPAVFLSSFIKEGVVYAIDAALLVQEKCSDSVSEHSNDHMVVRDTSRCMCHAFNSSRVSASESKTCRLQKDSIQSLARHIKTTYFTHEAVDSEMGFTETLQKLKILCTVLNDNVDSCSTSDGCLQNEENLTQILLQVMREFSEGESMSTFEFIESGIARFLSCYLSNGKYLSGTTSAIDLSSHTLTVLKRFQIFSSICLSNPGQSWDNMLLAVLLKKFQNALSSLDNFPVILSHGFKLRNTYTDIPVRGITKNPCLRVRFVRQNEDTNLSDLDNVVNVDISSSFDALEGYLWPKVNKGKNGHRTESADRKADDTTSGIKHVSEKNPIETHTNISQESCISNSAEVSRQEEQYLPAVDSSPKQTMSAKEVTEGSSASPSIGSAKPKLTFSLRGKQLDSSMTIYQAVLEEQKGAEFDMVVGSKFWSEVYKLTYKSAEPKANDSEMLNCVPQSSVFWNKHGFSDWKYPFLLAELPCKIDKLNASYDVLFMLKIFEGMNHYLFQLLSDERLNAFAEGRIENFDDLKVIVSSIPQVEFVNSKLNDKLEQQMQDPLVLTTGCMPSWCGQLMAACPFLFSFEARRKYFYLTTFGSLRSQQNNIQNLDGSGTNSLNDRHSYSGSLRKKFIVNRNNILESAVKMMKLHAQSKGTLEVEYAEEVGTGLGPTMEFFTLASHEFQKVGLGMWRGDLSYAGRSTIDGYSEFVLAPFGLFPRPWSTSTDVSGVAEFPEVIKMFLLLGKLVAKAIKDGRILDIPFSRAFYKIILEQELSICDIQSIDPELGRTMLEFQALVNRKRFLESISGDSSNLCYRNTSVKDLCLDFTLPGFPDYALLSESTKMVNIVNLEEYVTMVVDATIGSGISRQIDAFKSGFNEVFSLKALQIFTKDELERLLCGEQDCWDFTELVDHINFDHGYTGSSPTVVSFLEIIQELERDQRRAFLQFVTGSPRLPPGGLAALKPKLTVVRKQHSSCDADMDLPSVMTCANYLKLPPYSSKEKMRHKLLYAITEGQGSFHLS